MIVHVHVKEDFNTFGLDMDVPKFLNTLKPSGLPTNELKLKVGVPIMLTRNID